MKRPTSASGSTGYIVSDTMKEVNASKIGSFTSKHYHEAKKDAIADGCSTDKAAEKARDAYGKAKAIWELVRGSA